MTALRAFLTAIARALLLLLAVSAMVFVATELLPGDAAGARASNGATVEQVAALRAETGQDRPAWQRYTAWLGSLATGRLGTSLVNDRPVADAISQRLPASTALVVLALAFAGPLILVIGCWAGAGSRTRGTRTAVVTGLAAVPQVVLAAVLSALFAGALGWLPPVSLLPPGGSPLESPHLLILPVLSVALPTVVFGAGLLAGAVADTVRRPHAVDSRLRGTPTVLFFARDVVPFLLTPLARVVAISAGGLIAAATVVETLFGYPGLGSLLVTSVSARDTPVVQAVAMAAAAVVLGGLLLADVIAVLADPRRAPRPKRRAPRYLGVQP
ncbi:ABC transporter permease [Nocardiopsis ansamitocini]|uniref:ABC transporter permease n=1 Tax=Nocardiopsis ansamitocini TaxID=1670832 RepID=A0A9W6UL12_9ACTN|nr:ABC transporter permease [Nocardiopsis ansamitocini]GLU50193.1 ABC transporter permease [Nocardiopsis ansamitocini]